MTESPSHEEVRLLAGLVGIEVRDDDAAAVAHLLGGLIEAAQPLLELPFGDPGPFTRFDPRWR